jgi:predicted nuclease of predicted toxin-antitoxin system
VRLREFPLLADENVHSGVIGFLREAGCDVVTVREVGLRGEDDRVIIEWALPRRRVIITHDSDFGELGVASGQQIHGIVYLRPGHWPPEFTIETMIHLLDLDLKLAPPFLLAAVRSGRRVRTRLRQL